MTVVQLINVIFSNSMTYTAYTNSAIAVSFFTRSLACAALALASHKIVSSLGTKWGGE